MQARQDGAMPGVSYSPSSTTAKTNGPAQNPAQTTNKSNGQQQESLHSKTTLPDFDKLPASSRGGFAARAIKTAGSSQAPADVLSQARYDAPITRAESAMVLAQVMGLGSALEGQPAVFTDVPLNHWAAAAIYRCQEKGIFSGMGQDKFMPDSALGVAGANNVLQRMTTPLAFDRAKAIEGANKERDMPGPHDKVNGPMKDTKSVYDKHAATAEKAKEDLSYGEHKAEVDAFAAKWEQNHARYEAVADKTGVPAKLIAAIHWREGSGNFNTYLHQGDPLGKPAVHEPKNIPIFYKWEDAAVHALNMKDGIRKDLGMSKETTDLAAMATYAEYYNGLGYNNRGVASPYVYSGTDQYKRGKYVSDGHYSATTKDEQVGVLALMNHAKGGEQTEKATLVEGQVKEGKQGRGNLVVTLEDSKQQKWTDRTTADGLFSLSGKVAPGTASLEVGGKKQAITVVTGKPTWVTVEAAVNGGA